MRGEADVCGMAKKAVFQKILFLQAAERSAPFFQCFQNGIKQKRVNGQFDNIFDQPNSGDDSDVSVHHVQPNRRKAKVNHQNDC